MQKNFAILNLSKLQIAMLFKIRSTDSFTMKQWNFFNSDSDQLIFFFNACKQVKLLTWQKFQGFEVLKYLGLKGFVGCACRDAE